MSAEERLEHFKNHKWDSETNVFQNVWKTRQKLIVGYKAKLEEQRIIEKIEKYPRLGSLDNFRISRGEEGSKFNVVENKSGLFRMIIPADIEINYVAEGKTIDSTHLTPNKVSNIYTHSKIWITRIQKMRWEKRIVSALDLRTNSAGMKTLQTITVNNNETADLYFLQAVLSSRLINFYCVNYLSDDMNQAYLSRIPINFQEKTTNSNQELRQDLILITKKLIESKKEINQLKLQRDISQLDIKIEYYESKINSLVYQLYGLTEEEIKVIEGR